MAVICTSGTAVANYYPAVLEAESSRVPLLVLSGDRPARLQQLGAPQTCDQLKIFGNHVRQFWNMPEPTGAIEQVRYARQVAREALVALAPQTLVSAPVHINFRSMSRSFRHTIGQGCSNLGVLHRMTSCRF